MRQRQTTNQELDTPALETILSVDSCPLMAAITPSKHGTICCVPCVTHTIVSIRPFVHFHSHWTPTLALFECSPRPLQLLPNEGY